MTLQKFKKITINCDMGEGEATDAVIMPYIDCANICCGAHAGNDEIIANTISLAKQYQVLIGAHPGYRDMLNFGRKSLELSNAQIRDEIKKQYLHLKNLCDKQQVAISYIKPHGALNNDMVRNPEIFIALCQSIIDIDNNLPLMVPLIKDCNALKDIAKTHQVTIIWEAFADRAYDANGFLMSRQLAGTVYNDADKIVKQLNMLEQFRQVEIFASDKLLDMSLVDSVCVHGDNPASIDAILNISR